MVASVKTDVHQEDVVVNGRNHFVDLVVFALNAQTYQTASTSE
jgi:hypothetical protein